jgi:hypothetical protein
MNQRNMSLARDFTGAHNSYKNPDHNPWPSVLLAVTVDSQSTKDRFTSILDGVIKGCNVMVITCDQVLREVGDDAKYFELNQNFIKDYETQYGFKPFMPMSSTLAVLKNVTSTNALDFMPVHSLGEDQFKLMYGIRSLLNQPSTQPLMEHNPGFSQIVDSFNLTMDNKLQVDKSKADSFMKTFVKMLRYVTELKHAKGLLTPYIMNNRILIHPNAVPTTSDDLQVQGLFTRANLIHIDAATQLDTLSRVSIYAVSDKQAQPLPAFAIMKSISDSIKLTESSFKDEKIRDLTKYISGSEASPDDLAIQNIIDLDIVPINIHGLMRSFPLANLYNYGYTFDRLIVELYYGFKNEQAKEMIRDLCEDKGLKRINSAKDMLVALLINPYMSLFDDADNDGMKIQYYENYTKPMLSGAANNGELGRPKFLSDQIFNKAIFGELYNDYSEYNEMGPAAASVFRGKLPETVLANIIKDTANYIVRFVNSQPTKYLNTILALGFTGNDLLELVKSITYHVVKNPQISLKSLVNQIRSKFIPGIGIFDALATGGVPPTEAGRDQLAVFAAAIVKFVHQVFSKYFSIAKDNRTKINLNTMIAKLQSELSQLNDTVKLKGESGRDITSGAGGDVDFNVAGLIDAIRGLIKPTIRGFDTSQVAHATTGNNRLSEQLHWLAKGPEGNNNVLNDQQIKTVDVSNIKDILSKIGRLRFDTVLIRNLVFIVNLYRSVRMKLQRDLTYSKDIVIRSEPITRVQLTEFFGNDVHQIRDPYNTGFGQDIYKRYQ